MTMSTRRGHPGVLRCTAASAAVEFALAAPILFLLIIGMFEIAMVMFISVAVEGGLREAARFGITGVVPVGVTRQEQILNILGTHTLGLIDIASSTITLKAYDNFSDIGQPEPFNDTSPANGVYDLGEAFTDLNGNAQWDADRGVDGVGSSGEVVLYKIDYDWLLFTPIVAHLLTGGDALHLTASVAVRNEPFIAGGG